MAALVEGPDIGPYHVVRPLGAGGMGEVFLARDSRLGRDVALKWLTGPDASAPGARERLLHEARVAATLNHANIAAIYDVVEAGERAAIVMEYVEGETLADRVARGRLTSEETLDIAQQLVEALAHAHARGIIHRDIKPSNVRVTPDGRVKLLDLGLARLPLAPLPSSESDVTTSAVVSSRVFAGTPAYMAPEQLLGQHADARSDIYGVGVLLFELLTGQRPFGSNLASSMMAALSAPQPHASDLAPGISPDLDAIVFRAMARDPGARFPSASAMLAALRAVRLPSADMPVTRPDRRPFLWRSRGFLLAASLVFTALVVGGIVSWLQGNSARARDDRRVVAVLPFENLGGDATKEYLGVGVSDWLVSRLASVPALTVATAATATEARQLARDLRKAARDLDADLIVTGSVQPANNRLLISARIVSPGGRVTWGQSYEGSFDELLALQGRVVDGVSGALNVKRATPAAPPTTSADAYTDYAQGRTLLERGDIPGYVGKSIEAFRRAVRIDPGFALAYAGIADACWQQYRDTKAVSWAECARDAADRATRIAPETPAVRVSRARILRGTGHPDEAATELRRVLEAQPNDDGARRLLAQTLGDLGRTDEALAEFDRAIAVRPEYIWNHTALGLYLFGLARYQEAAIAFEKATALRPDSPSAFANLGAAYQMMGDRTRAFQQYERVLALDPNDVTALSNVGTLQFDEGRFREAVTSFERVCALSPRDAVSFRNLGDAYAAVNDSARAHESFVRAVDLQRDVVKMNPKDATALAMLATYEAKAGRRGDAGQHAVAAFQLQPDHQDVLYAVAVVRALAGQTRESLAMLEGAIAHGYSRERAGSDPDLASLRALPRFHEIIGQRAQ